MEGKKLDELKIMWQLLPMGALEEVAKVLTYGTIKYSAWNWYHGLSYSRCVGAMLRHLKSWFWDREEYDPESKCHHLAAVSFYGLVMLTFALEERTEVDDRIRKLCTLQSQAKSSEG